MSEPKSKLVPVQSCKGLPEYVEPDWIGEMRDHFEQTGACRAEHYLRIMHPEAYHRIFSRVIRHEDESAHANGCSEAPAPAPL